MASSNVDSPVPFSPTRELRRVHIQAVLGFAAERERRLSALPAVS
jgi:hypothetical protein